jgi:putative transposase
MIRAFKYRIYPTERQKQQIENNLNACRFVYNLALETKSYAWKQFWVNIGRYELQKQAIDLRKNLPWLKEANAQSICNSLLNLDKAYSGFFKGKGFPRFKLKSSKQSFHCPGNLRRIDWGKNTLSVSKIYEIPIVLSRKFEGKIKTVTISRTPTGKYFASILVDTSQPIPEKQPIKSVLGIDTGIKTFLTCSDGQTFENNRYLKTSIERLKVLQRRASKKKKGSQNRRKAFHKVTVLHEKITNQRLDYIHKATHKLTSENQAIAIEDLNVKGIMANHKLAQAMSDVSLSKFYEILKYKCEWRGVTLLKIGRFEPSSKTCSDCGWKKADLTLSDREFICHGCGMVKDRDLNAAINIRNSGQGLSGVPVESLTIVGAEKQEC